MCEKCVDLLVDNFGVPRQIAMEITGEAEKYAQTREADSRMERELMLAQREISLDMSARTHALMAAVKVKGETGDSRQVLASAHAYYDFIIAKDDNKSTQDAK